jgi:4-hydroxybenzoate polyprenyltransferase
VTLDVALRLGRVSNLPTVWSNVLAAAVLAGSDAAAPSVALAALACSLSYVGGMFLNDAFDREFDAKFRPDRPVPAGDASVSAVFAVGFALLAAGLVLVVVVGRAHAAAAAVSGLALAGVITLYDAWHKGNPLGPLLMGLCRVLVYVTTAVALTGHASDRVLAGAGLLLVYLMGLTYLARQEHLASIRRLWPLVLLAVPFMLGVRLLMEGGAGAVLYLGFLGWVVLSVSHLGWRGPRDVPRAIAGLIAGIALLDAILIAGHGASGTALLAVVAFALTVLGQRWVAGT